MWNNFSPFEKSGNYYITLCSRFLYTFQRAAALADALPHLRNTYSCEFLLKNSKTLFLQFPETSKKKTLRRKFENQILTPKYSTISNILIILMYFWVNLQYLEIHVDFFLNPVLRSRCFYSNKIKFAKFYNFIDFIDFFF